MMESSQLSSSESAENNKGEQESSGTTRCACTKGIPELKPVVS